MKYNWNVNEISACAGTDCVLWAFRDGHWVVYRYGAVAARGQADVERWRTDPMTSAKPTTAAFEELQKREGNDQ